MCVYNTATTNPHYSLTSYLTPLPDQSTIHTQQTHYPQPSHHYQRMGDHQHNFKLFSDSPLLHQSLNSEPTTSSNINILNPTSFIRTANNHNVNTNTDTTSVTAPTLQPIPRLTQSTPQNNKHVDVIDLLDD